MSIPMVFALVAFAGIFLVFLGFSRMRRAAGGSEDFQARLAAYGVTTAGATALPPASGLRESLNRLFQPAADRVGRGDTKKGKPSVSEQLLRADLKLRTSEFFMIQIGTRSSVAQAIDTVAKNAVPPIADEFGRAVREMNLGGSPDEALQNITKRVASPDFDLVATAYSIHRTVGGNLAEILDNISYTIRERVRIKGEIATLTAQARASGTLITFLPIVLAVFMYFVTPTYFRPMFENFIGWVVIAHGGFVIFIGNLIIRRVVAIEV